MYQQENQKFRYKTLLLLFISLILTPLFVYAAMYGFKLDFYLTPEDTSLLKKPFYTNLLFCYPNNKTSISYFNQKTKQHEQKIINRLGILESINNFNKLHNLQNTKLTIKDSIYDTKNNCHWMIYSDTLMCSNTLGNTINDSTIIGATNNPACDGAKIFTTWLDTEEKKNGFKFIIYTPEQDKLAISSEFIPLNKYNKYNVNISKDFDIKVNNALSFFQKDSFKNIFSYVAILIVCLIIIKLASFIKKLIVNFFTSKKIH